MPPLPTPEHGGCASHVVCLIDVCRVCVRLNVCGCGCGCACVVQRNIISLHTCAFWALFAFCAVTFVLFFIKLIGLETSCPEPWNCASGWSKLRRDDYEYCVPPTICGAGQAYWQGSCQPYTVCSYGNGFPYVSVPGMACDEGLLCMPKPFNRTASECVLDILCKVPPHLVGIKRFNGDACVRSGESCWVKYDMNAKVRTTRAVLSLLASVCCGLGTPLT